MEENYNQDYEEVTLWFFGSTIHISEKPDRIDFYYKLDGGHLGNYSFFRTARRRYNF